MICGAHPHQQDNVCAPCLIDMPWNSSACSLCAEHMENNDLNSDLICSHCLEEPPPYRRAVCAFDYLAPVNGLINLFKHQHNLAAGRLLTACLSKAISEANSRAGAQGESIMPQLLIPVPLHRHRLRQRGFNQAQFIATGLSQSLNLKMNTRLCSRGVYQAPQQEQSRQQRLSQMTGVFQIKSEGIDQKINSIAIVDDVMTTGATAQALSSSLINAWSGPLDIQIWCVARAQSPNVQIEW
jgi:ComF family protein